MSHSLAISGYFRKNQMRGGVASVLHNLLRGIEERIETDERRRDLQVVVFHGPDGVPFRSKRFVYRETPAKFGRFAADARLGAFESESFDATLFLNYFTPPVIRSRRTVTIVHDLLHVHFPKVISRRKRIWLDCCHRWTLRRADAVVAISQAVKDDVLRQYGQKWADRLSPIWNPISLDRFNGDEPQHVTGGRPYILGVAIDRPLKNLFSLVRAFDKLRERLPEFCLVLAGELRSQCPGAQQHSAQVDGEMPSAVDLVRALGLSDHVKITGFVSDAQLGALYRGASAFVLPSLFEGFGMPAIESLALGAPTLLSDLPVFREITMNRAEYLRDPLDPAAIADHIEQIIKQGDAARPTAETMALMRRSYAPSTIAGQYLDVLLRN